jgi:hypothetical protein
MSAIDEEDEGYSVIEISFDESAMTDEAEEALTDEQLLFHRGGRLVRIVLDGPGDKVLLRSPHSPRISPLTAPILREMLSKNARFERVTFDAGPDRPATVKRAGVPDTVVRALLDRGEWTLRRLRAVVDAPVLRANGTVVESPGYDPATELFFWPTTKFPAPPELPPTQEDAIRARDRLLEAVRDFPFERPAHKCAWLAAALTPFARHAYDGPTPLFVIDKNVRGCGGTLLADVIGILATGRPMPRMVAAKDSEEERKRITAIALAGDPIALIDNVAGTLGTDSLDAALTGTTWKDRVLGKSEMVTLPWTAVLYASGNNIVFGEDTLRRVCPIRLASPEERPEERTGFAHPRLLEWVAAERPRLVDAALTILSAYCCAGQPDMGLKPWGSFEAWSDIVRNAVVWVGLTDPAEAREELATTADTTRNALENLLVGWRALFGDAGGTISMGLAALEKDSKEIIPRHMQLAAAIAELVPSAPGKAPSGLSLGKRMQRARGRVVAGLALEHREGNAKAGVVWVVRQVVKQEAGGVGGVPSPSQTNGVPVSAAPTGGVGGVGGVVSPPYAGEEENIYTGMGQKNTSNTSNTSLPLRKRSAAGHTTQPAILVSAATAETTRQGARPKELGGALPLVSCANARPASSPE